MLLKILKYLIPIALFIFIGFELGYTHVHTEWSKAKLEYYKKILELKDQISNKEQQYKEDIDKINQKFSKQKAAYEKHISVLKSGSSDIMSKHESRTKIYRSESTGSESDRQRLANRAAKLDKSLSEGRQLVKEFREHLDFCRNQNEALIQRIKTEQSLWQNKTTY